MVAVAERDVVLERVDGVVPPRKWTKADILDLSVFSLFTLIRVFSFLTLIGSLFMLSITWEFVWVKFAVSAMITQFVFQYICFRMLKRSYEA